MVDHGQALMSMGFAPVEAMERCGVLDSAKAFLVTAVWKTYLLQWHWRSRTRFCLRRLGVACRRWGGIWIVP